MGGSAQGSHHQRISEGIAGGGPGTRWVWPGSLRAPLSTWSPISFDPAFEEEHRLDFPPQRRTASIDLNFSSHKEGSHELMKVRQNRTNERLWLEATESETD